MNKEVTENAQYILNEVNNLLKKEVSIPLNASFERIKINAEAILKLGDTDNG